MRYSYSKTFQRTRNLSFKILVNSSEQTSVERPALKDRYLDNEFFWTVLAHLSPTVLDASIQDIRINNLPLPINIENNGYFSAVIPDEVDTTKEIFFSYKVQMNIRKQDHVYISIPAPAKRTYISFNFREIKDEVNVDLTSTFQGNRLDPAGEINYVEDGFLAVSNLGWVVPDSGCSFIWFQKYEKQG